MFNQIIAEDWANDPAVTHACLTLLNHASSASEGTLLGLGDIRQVVGYHIYPGKVMQAIQYLCGDRVPLLSAVFQLADGTEISHEHMNNALTTQRLLHPKTGEEIEDFYARTILSWRFNKLETP